MALFRHGFTVAVVATVDGVVLFGISRREGSSFSSPSAATHSSIYNQSMLWIVFMCESLLSV